MKLNLKLSNYFDIIRMEREDIEKQGVEVSMSGI